MSLSRLSLLAFASCAALAAAAPSAARAAVWEAKNTWDETWERRYQDWVARDFSKDYFHNKADELAFGLELDCSDAVYTMRILFARANSLPFVINNPSGKGVISHEMTKWDNYRETLKEELDDGTWKTYQGPVFDDDQKLRAFIEHVNVATTTMSLINDTYPVALSEVRPGDMFLIPDSHVYIIKTIEPTGAMATLSASSPKAWRPMAEVHNFPAEVPKDKNRRDGYRRFKQEAFLRAPAQKSPGASFEQWTVAASVKNEWDAFALATQEALAEVKETTPQKADRLLRTICDYAVQRVEVVNVAQDALRRLAENHGGKCFGTGDYNEYSTPGRDAKLEGHFRVLRALIDSPEWRGGDFPAKRPAESVFGLGTRPMNDDEMMGMCAVPFDIETGRRMHLRHLWAAVEAGKIASDPHAPVDYRWGVAPAKWKPACPSAKAD